MSRVPSTTGGVWGQGPLGMPASGSAWHSQQRENRRLLKFDQDGYFSPVQLFVDGGVVDAEGPERACPGRATQEAAATA